MADGRELVASFFTLTGAGIGCHVDDLARTVASGLDGEPDHRDSILDARAREANDCVMICVSRACSPRLVLDL